MEGGSIASKGKHARKGLWPGNTLSHLPFHAFFLEGNLRRPFHSSKEEIHNPFTCLARREEHYSSV
jgi:hypothetical protein